MDALAEELNAKLERWQPQTRAEVRARVAEIIALADEDALELGRSRALDQEVLDLIDDEPAFRGGEVWLADLGLAAKTRPVVIVSRHDPAAPRALALYVPLTTQPRGSDYEASLPRLGFLRETSTANVQGLASLAVVRLERRLGMLPAETMAAIKAALAFALELK